MREIYQKTIANIESTDDDKFGPNGGFTAILSTPSLDRDGDRLHRDEWIEPLPDRLPLDIDHGMSVADTVGSFHPYFDGDTMMMDAHFASTPRAQEVRTLVQEGHISSVSIAFMTDKSRKDGEPRREILNAGIVSTPSNRDAVILASKAADALKDALSDATEGDVPEEIKAAVLEAISPAAEESKSARIYVDVTPRLDEDALKRVMTEIATKAVGGDGALVQAIHDASSHLGAACAVMEPDADPDSGASSGANKSIDFSDKSGQTISFGSHAEAREFFTDSIESLDSADARGVTLVEVEQLADVAPSESEGFEKRLDDILTPQDESPAEAAAATDEVPAPADEAADETDVASEYAVSAEALRLRLTS